jgi:hypothetical protein
MQISIRRWLSIGFSDFCIFLQRKYFTRHAKLRRSELGHGPFPHQLHSSIKSDAFIESCSFYPWSLLKTFLRASPTMRFFFGWLAALCALKYACNKWSRTIYRIWQHSKSAAFDFYCQKYKEPCESVQYYFLLSIARLQLLLQLARWWDCNVSALLHVNVILNCFF